jgi:hypothetical protein
VGQAAQTPAHPYAGRGRQQPAVGQAQELVGQRHGGFIGVHDHLQRRPHSCVVDQVAETRRGGGEERRAQLPAELVSAGPSPVNDRELLSG